MSKKDNRKTANMVEIESHIYQWVVEDANSVGEKLSKHIGDLLNNLYHMSDGGKKSPTQVAREYSPITSAIVAYQEMERQQHRRSMVRHMAALYVEKPSEKAADSLQAACDAIDIDYDEVIKVAEADPFSSIIAKTMGKDKIDRCAVWMIDLFTKHGKMQSVELFSRANAEGYNKRMVQRVKRNLLEDLDTPYIDVDRIGKNWWYVLKTVGGNEIEATEPEAIYSPEEDRMTVLQAFLDTGKPITIILNDSDEEEVHEEGMGIFNI